MEILSEVGVPMTNGEVYALVRRRRDERNAAQHPPFCRQLQQADAHNRASSQYMASRFGTSAAAGGRARVNNAVPVERGVLSPVESAQAASAVLATPAAGHLVVLLTEVKLLNYLVNHSHLSRTARLTDIYGPPSVYEAVTALRAEEAGSDAADATAATTSPQHASSHEARVAKQCALVRSTPPGTVAHVAAVDAWLHLHEQRGQAQEKAWATAIKQVVARLAAVPPASTNALKVEEAKAADNGPGAAITSAASKPLSAYRVLLAPPTALPHNEVQSADMAVRGRTMHVKLEVDEDEAPLTAAVAGPRALVLHLSDDELLRLVVGRPQSTLDVYRLLDHLESRFGGDEERLTTWCTTLEEVFAARNS